jgi:hypothetical protein
MKTSTPERVQLIFNNSDAALALDLPPDVSVGKAAMYVLGFLPKTIQKEIVALVASDKNGALEIPKEKDTYAAKTTKGYGIIYQSSDDKKTIIQVVPPADLERFMTGPQ